MSLQDEPPVPASKVWCGRSWQGLVDRRHAAFAHAQALRHVMDQDSHRIVSDFLEFFDRTGVGLFRDEEEWVFRSLRPTPAVVLRALEGHIEISSLIGALLNTLQAGCVDLRVVHRLGGLLEAHLLLEEEEIRPLLRTSGSLLPAT